MAKIRSSDIRVIIVQSDAEPDSPPVYGLHSRSAQDGEIVTKWVATLDQEAAENLLARLAQALGRDLGEIAR